MTLERYDSDGLQPTHGVLGLVALLGSARNVAVRHRGVTLGGNYSGMPCRRRIPICLLNASMIALISNRVSVWRIMERYLIRSATLSRVKQKYWAIKGLIQSVLPRVRSSRW